MAPPVDPNWLLSTTAQSAAALVAIIGGLLVSRLVAAATARQGLQLRLDENHAQRGSKRTDLDELTPRLDATYRSWFRRSAIVGVVEGQAEVSVSDFMRMYASLGVPADKVHVWARELEGEVAEWFRRIERVTKLHEISIDIAELEKRGMELGSDDREIVEAVAEAVRRRKREHIAGGSPASQSGDAQHSVGAPTSHELQQQYDRRQAIAALSADLRALSFEEKVITGQLAQLAKPRGVYQGAATLAFFALVGIVIPLRLMTLRPVPATPGVRNLVVLGFVAGLIALLLYLVWLLAVAQKR